MSKQNEYIDLASGEIIKDESTPRNLENQNITINDAQSEIGKILVHEFGSDIDHKENGMVDVRRFSNISKLDVYWLMYFMNMPENKGGEFAKKICMEYLNNRYSVNGSHKRTTIDFQSSLNNRSENSKQEDKRNWIQKHITQRGKEP